MEFSFVYF
jgi:hypothetical protein